MVRFTASGPYVETDSVLRPSIVDHMQTDTPMLAGVEGGIGCARTFMPSAAWSSAAGAMPHAFTDITPDFPCACSAPGTAAHAHRMEMSAAARRRTVDDMGIPPEQTRHQRRQHDVNISARPRPSPRSQKEWQEKRPLSSGPSTDFERMRQIGLVRL